jgi:CRISPR-associated protein Csh1
VILEAVRRLGLAALERSPFAEALVDTEILEQSTKTRGRTEEKYVVILNLRSDPWQLEFDIRSLSEEAVREFIWVGNARGANSPQDRLTTDNPEYLISQAIPNILASIPNGELREILWTIRQNVYLDLGEKSEVFPSGGDTQYERYRYLWNLPKLGLTDAHFLPKNEREEVEKICQKEKVTPFSREFLQAYAREKGSAKEACKLLGSALQQWAAQKFGIKPTNIALYTLAFQGKPLAQHPDYRAYIEQKLVDEAFEKAIDGVCHLCGKKERVTKNTTRFRYLKFYITDKLGFASRLTEDGFFKNFALCKECYRGLLAGEQWVENHLQTRLGDTNVYVIPVFHLSEAYPSSDELKAWAGYLKDRLAAANTFENWKKFQEVIQRYQHYEEQKSLFILNFLFVTKEKAAVKVNKLIPDVPPSRLDRLDEVRQRVRDRATEFLGPDKNNEWDLNLKSMYFLLPLHRGKDGTEITPYLNLLDALFTGRPLEEKALIRQFLEVAEIHRFQRYDQYVQKRPKAHNFALELALLQSQLFLIYLKELGLLSRLLGGGRKMNELKAKEEVEKLLDPDLRSWMDGLGLEGARRGLFLMGVLIGKIGSEPEQIESKKPILNKLTFQGMDRLKVMRLANEIYEKLRQYKIADKNEVTYAVAKAHLDPALNELDSPQENVFWILSGYSYATWKAIQAGKEKKEVQG